MGVLPPHRCRHTSLLLTVLILFLQNKKVFGNKNKQQKREPFELLASALLPRLLNNKENGGSDSGDIEVTTEKKVERALESLSRAQRALKGLDGAAHEAYQRTHRGSDRTGGAKVSGRAMRSADRAGCAADALFAAELCDFILSTPSPVAADENEDGRRLDTLSEDRQIVLNVTNIATSLPSSLASTLRGKLPSLSILLLWDPSYRGGAGLDHGGIDQLQLSSNQPPQKARGRWLVVVSDNHANNLSATIHSLDIPPQFVTLDSGLIANEVASVSPLLWYCAGTLLRTIAPVLQTHFQTKTTNQKSHAAEQQQQKQHQQQQQTMIGSVLEKEQQPAIHFVGRSMAGAIACLAASILDGTLPMPPIIPSNKQQTKKKKTRIYRNTSSKTSSSTSHSSKVNTNGHDSLSSNSKSKTRRRKRKHPSSVRGGGEQEQESTSIQNDHTSTNNTTTTTPNTNNNNTATQLDASTKIPPTSIFGWGRGRCSAVALGPPPCLSSNVRVAFVTSLIFGDDIIPRTTSASLSTLYKRTWRTIKSNVFTKQMSWMTNALSLTVSGLNKHAHGSEGEEGRLSLPGKVYILRPRRLAKHCSMHEVGNVGNSLRASVLWQLDNVLVSRSFWSHHSLHAYIDGLDRVQLRQYSERREKEDYEEEE